MNLATIYAGDYGYWRSGDGRVHLERLAVDGPDEPLSIAVGYGDLRIEVDLAPQDAADLAHAILALLALPTSHSIEKEK